MSDRVTVSVRREHIFIFANLVDSIKLGLDIKPWFANPSNATAMQNMAGAMNKAEAEQPPAPPVDPSDPFADLRFRKTISNWAAFGNDFWTANELHLLKMRPELALTADQIKNYYKTYANFAGKREGNTFWFSDGAQWQPDVNGAADAQVLKFSNGVPPPSINIP